MFFICSFNLRFYPQLIHQRKISPIISKFKPLGQSKWYIRERFFCIFIRMKLYKISNIGIFFKCGYPDYLYWKKILVYIIAGDPNCFSKEGVESYKIWWFIKKYFEFQKSLQFSNINHIQALRFEFLQTRGLMLGLCQNPTYIKMDEDQFENLEVSVSKNGMNLPNVQFYTGDPILGNLQQLFVT